MKTVCPVAPPQWPEVTQGGIGNTVIRSRPEPRRSGRSSPCVRLPWGIWRLQCDRMHVPSDSFNGRSPEKQASLMIERLFTFCACKIVLAQLQGDGRGDLGSYGGGQYQTLREFMSENPLGGGIDSRDWIQRLLQTDRALGLRIIETRYAYASRDFEWDQMQRVALEGMDAGNIETLRGLLERDYRTDDEGGDEEGV